MALALAALIPTAAAGTTGGDDAVEVLGYALGDGKLYWLRVNDDGSDDLDELYYLILDGPRAGTVVPVSSWARDVEDADDPFSAFAGRVDALRRRLRPGKSIEPSCHVDVAVLDVQPNNDPEMDPGWNERWPKRYSLGVSVAHPARPDKSQTFRLTAYGQRVEVVTEMRVPGRNFAVVVLRYFSMPYEYGYTSDVAVVVPLTDAAEAAGEKAPAVPYVPFRPMEDGIDRFMR